MVFLSGQQLKSVPSWVRDLTALTELSLSDNQLTDLPNWLGDLTSLTKLYLLNNLFTAVPEVLQNLTSLTELNLGRNLLTAVPEWLGDLTALTQLYLSYNKLTELPESLGNLTALANLYLGGNQLTSLPKSMGNLTALTSCDFTNNPGNLYQQFSELLETRRASSLISEQVSNVADVSPVQTTPVREPHAVSIKPSPVVEAFWTGDLLDTVWIRLRSLFMPSVSLAAVLIAADTRDPAAAVLQLYTWERDRLLTLAKGTAGAAITVLTGLIAAAVEGKIVSSAFVVFFAAALVPGLLFWGGLLLTGVRRLAEEYAAALDLTEQK